MSALILDNDLFREYYNFKHPEKGQRFKVVNISRILQFSGNSILTNLRQWKELKLPDDEELAIRLALDDDTKDLSLEDLTLHSRLKIILTKDKKKTNFPYVYLQSDIIEPVVGGFLMKGSSRDKAIKHLKALCSNAKEIILYDNYFANKKSQNINTLLSILPTSGSLKIIYDKPCNPDYKPFDNDCISILSVRCPEWTYEQRNLPEHHDRYMILDTKIEIILTSGFDNLGSTTKEISYIIRDYKNRF